MSSGSATGRWAIPQRRWQRPTRGDVAGSFFWVAFVAGAWLAITGDSGSLVVGGGSILASMISSYHRADEEAPYAKRFSDPPDASTQLLVHDAVSQDQLPSEAGLKEVALDYIAGWSRRLKRGLGLAVVVALGCCLICGLLVRLLDRWWPESTPTRAWGLAITVVGAICWVLHAGIPGLRRLRRLRRLQRRAGRGLG